MYNASKAALISGSETWRLELAPLEVRVITLVTGGIATNFMTNLQTLTMPESSYYQPIRDVIEVGFEENPYGMKPEVFAKQVLQKVERGATGKIWIGGGVGMIRPALWLMPQSIVVSAPAVSSTYADKKIIGLARTKL
jgi:1-acylglycerone phosphate reductase